jgi:heme/copper-type cytochrome/quinol oxidase subunit 2
MEASSEMHGSTERFGSVKRGRWVAVIGVALYTGPIWGLFGTVIGMLRAFDSASANEAVSSAAMSQSISFALTATMISITVGLIGAILILVVLFGAKNREGWFFWWSVILSVFWCSQGFPFGLVAGLPILIYFVTKRMEFRKPSKTPA